MFCHVGRQRGDRGAAEFQFRDVPFMNTPLLEVRTYVRHLYMPKTLTQGVVQRQEFGGGGGGQGGLGGGRCFRLHRVPGGKLVGIVPAGVCLREK